MSEDFEPRQGGLYLPKFTLMSERKWTGFGNYSPKYETKEKPLLDFFDPETGLIFKDQGKFLGVPLLFLKTKRCIRTRRGHAQIEHLDDHGMACFGNETNIGSPNQWDESQHISADVFYEYHFLFENTIVAVSIDANKSFGEYFHETTNRKAL